MKKTMLMLAIGLVTSGSLISAPADPAAGALNQQLTEMQSIVLALGKGDDYSLKFQALKAKLTARTAAPAAAPAKT